MTEQFDAVLAEEIPVVGWRYHGQRAFKISIERPLGYTKDSAQPLILASDHKKVLDRLAAAHAAEVGERDEELALAKLTATHEAEYANKMRARAEAAERGARRKCADAVPSNWCDPLLTGPNAVLRGNGGTWGCPDIERLLAAIKARIDACMGEKADES